MLKKKKKKKIFKFQIRIQISASTSNFEFLKQFSRTRILPNKNTENEYYHWILYIRISLGIKLYSEQRNLNFGTKFAPNRFLWSKTEKVNITIKFCIFELVLGPNFSFSWKFVFFRANLPKKDIRKKWTLPLHSAHSNYSSTKFYFTKTIFNFGAKFSQKGHFWSKTK